MKKMGMNYKFCKFVVKCLPLILLAIPCYALAFDDLDVNNELLKELVGQEVTQLESLVRYASILKHKEGFASYYAERHAGKRTASGERYNPGKFTAAHSRYPLGTVVKVVNIRNRKDVLVVVNDRCAAKPYPFIDLSRAAAQKIGLFGKGKIKVDIIPLFDKQL